MPTATFEHADDIDAINKLYRERCWSDGLPIVPPTRERVARMLAHTQRKPDELIAKLAPGFGEATVERIAVNAVMAGCDPEYLPLLLAAASAVAEPQFNLQGVEATTNPAAVWLVVNGPIVQQLGINATYNCLGQGTWANATLGRAMRLILQNIGGALPGGTGAACEIHVVLWRKRRAKPVGAAPCGARLQGKAKHGDGGRGGRHAQYEHALKAAQRVAARVR
jgi:hypothetical protein